MISKRITFFGQPALIACDGQCHKAWGINSRPRVYIPAGLNSEDGPDPDNWYWPADHELGFAPADPGTDEGGHLKPSETVCADPALMNKWCARECERCYLSMPGEYMKEPKLRDFDQRVYNIPRKS